MNTILLIESNANILENFTEYFEIEGFKVLAASNGNLGVSIAREHIPNLIISAIRLREMDGYEVLRLLLNSSVTAMIPFIFCTTKCEKIDRIEALELGADDYIVKPNSMELMCSMAKMWIISGSKRHN